LPSPAAASLRPSRQRSASCLAARRMRMPPTPGHLHPTTTATASRLHYCRLAWDVKEDDMPATLTPTCSSCGLRFASRPLLELHIREDHLQRDHHAEPDHGDAARGGASQPHTDAPARTQGRSSRLPRTIKEVITVTVTPWRRRLRAGWAMTAARAVIHTIRHIHAELLLASEAMLRPPGAPQPRSRAEIPVSPPERAGRARAAVQTPACAAAVQAALAAAVAGHRVDDQQRVPARACGSPAAPVRPAPLPGVGRARRWSGRLPRPRRSTMSVAMRRFR
jgi:hypothetical protein